VNRYIWIDNARITSCIAIVLLHTASGLVYNTPNLNGMEWWSANLYNAFTRWSAPFFLMITGALLLDPLNKDDVLTFYRKRLGRIVVPILVWTLFYGCIRLIDAYSGHTPLTKALGNLGIDILAGKPYYHLWYLYMLVGLYLFLPLLRYCVAAAPRKDLVILCCAWFLIAMSNSIISSCTQGQSSAKLSFFLGSFFNFAPYCLAGYLIATAKSIPDKRLLWTGFCIMGCASALVTLVLGEIPCRGKFYCYGFLSIPTVIMAIALFMIFSRFEKPFVNSRFVRFAAPLTFGVYLLHPAILKGLTLLHIDVRAFLPAVSIPLVACLAAVISGLAIAVLSRIPGVRKSLG
jgi:surface polysaccharide O-acyltransferase-like enzyme